MKNVTAGPGQLKVITIFQFVRIIKIFGVEIFKLKTFKVKPSICLWKFHTKKKLVEKFEIKRDKKKSQIMYWRIRVQGSISIEYQEICVITVMR